MKIKRYIIFIMMFSIILVISACSSQNEETTVNLTFSEYYQNADDFEKIYPLLNEYFACIENAYKESDKMDLNSFVLSDNYNDISNQLSAISKDDSKMRVNGELNTSDEYIARIKIINPYLQMELHLSGKELLKTSNSTNENWFKELETILTEIYSEYENGTGK